MTGRILKFFRQPPNRWFLLVKAGVLLLLIHWGLHLLPFRRLYGMVLKLSKPRTALGPDSEQYLSQATWAIQRTGRVLFGEEACLAKALTGYLLLRRRGYPASLKIGTMKGSTGELQAHAWLEVDGQAVIGGRAEELKRFIPLSEIDGAGL